MQFIKIKSLLSYDAMYFQTYGLLKMLIIDVAFITLNLECKIFTTIKVCICPLSGLNLASLYKMDHKTKKKSGFYLFLFVPISILLGLF